jgi:Tfp pilus assembly protein PilV
MPASVSGKAEWRRISGSLRRRCGHKRAGSVLDDESGYSLVEVMASIIILSVAIIPMVAMFDAGLGAATRGGNYDKARAFVNERLERAKVLPYETVRDGFPVAPSTPGAGGAYTSPELAVPGSARLPDVATYTVTKRYVVVPPDPSGASSVSLADSDADTGMIRVTVTVEWSGNSIGVSGLVAGGAE